MKVNRHTIPTLIEKREAFKNASGTLRSHVNPSHEDVTYWLEKGHLEDMEADRLRVDSRIHGLSYIVISFDTPIAWETKEGHVYKVEQTYTQTTSKHQGLLYLFHPRET